MASIPHVHSLVLDATPLITQPYAHYKGYAQNFYTTPTVFHEIKDENAKRNLDIWQAAGALQLRHPSESSIKRVSDFAKLTGDASVLSANDIHILALTYELEAELNGDKGRLRRYPGEVLVPKAAAGAQPPVAEKKKRRRGGKKQRAKREEAAQQAAGEAEEATDDIAAPANAPVESAEQPTTAPQAAEALTEDYDEADDDGDWITPDNLTEMMIQDSGEDTTGNEGVAASDSALYNQVALATGDFAIQNVALQINLNLMNFTSGMRIKKLRNYMLRCHACFKLLPTPRDGRPVHFCPSCGGAGTVLRCAVSVDAETGAISPHLKANFQWNNRGNRYSLPSPLSKASQKRFGNKGFVHTRHQQEVPLLREDQKEFQQAMKQEDWTRRHNEKVLNSWIGGGSADNYMSPFAITGLKHHSVRVGRGRHVNSSNKRK
ncbi:AaceriAAR139Wp [[Ashbya] aceris (nom. inval.)]|nr:AaceriAAR139Wp [[Ashbya] aceris (nom. inval.)]